MSISRSDKPVAIIGAGICGASAARALTDAGVSAVVYEKAAAAGGRASTRLRSGAHFDHGAQYFTARDARFLRQVQDWQNTGVVARWQPRLVAIDAPRQWRSSSDEVRWVGTPGMASLATQLLDRVDVRFEQRVLAVERRGVDWYLRLQDGTTHGPFSALICTLPAPQVAQLLNGEALAETALRVAFAPCWALMLEFDQALPVEMDAAFVNFGPLSWIARDSSKPGRPAIERWLAHGGPSYSAAHLEASAEHISSDLAAAFFDALGVAPCTPRACTVHRWRYALAQPPLQMGALFDAERQIAVAGDWCHGSRIEGAWLSGLRAAQWLIPKTEE